MHWFYHSSVKQAVPIVPARVLICTLLIGLEPGNELDLEDIICLLLFSLKFASDL